MSVLPMLHFLHISSWLGLATCATVNIYETLRSRYPGSPIVQHHVTFDILQLEQWQHGQMDAQAGFISCRRGGVLEVQDALVSTPEL